MKKPHSFKYSLKAVITPQHFLKFVKNIKYQCFKNMSVGNYAVIKYHFFHDIFKVKHMKGMIKQVICRTSSDLNEVLNCIQNIK